MSSDFLADIALFRQLLLLFLIQQWAACAQPMVGSSSRINMTNEEAAPIYCSFCRCQNSTQEHVVNCTDLGLLRIPNAVDNETVIFDIRCNKITKLKNHSFYGLMSLRELILARNQISIIEKDAFKALVSLELLDLSNNDIQNIQYVLKPGMFLNLRKLRLLYLHKNVIHPRYALRGIPESPIIEATALEYLSIDGVINASFGSGYRNLTKLTNITMSGSFGYCRIESLTRFSFQNVPALEYLVLDKCDIKHIESETFCYVQRLNYLDLSWNFDLEFNGFGQAAYGLKFTALRELKINAIHHPYRAGTEILRENMQHIRDLKLETMNMDDNGIEYIDYGVSSMLPSSLSLLTLRRNRLHFGFYLQELVFNNPNLVVLDAGDQEVAIRSDIPPYVKYAKKRKRRYARNAYGDNSNISNETRDDASKRSIQHLHDRAEVHVNTLENVRYKRFEIIRKHSNEVRVKKAVNNEEQPEYDYDDIVPLELKTLICTGSRSQFPLLDFCGVPNNIVVMDISENFVPVISENAFLGLNELRKLNLSYNYVEKLHWNAFAGLENLKVLDLAGNLLGFEIRSDVYILSHFSHLTHLNLSYNRISRIPRGTFASLTHLESLTLSYNHLNHFDVRMKNLKHLKLLDLSDNKIQCLSVAVMDELDTIATSHSIAVNLKGNKLLCTCETRHFLKWLVTTQIELVNIETYYCSLNNGSTRFLNASDELLKNLHEECKSYLHLTVGGSAGVSFVFTLTVFYAIYKNRWKLRYMYYMTKVKLDLNQGNGSQDHCFTFDAFISYADGDRYFVIKNIIEHLEETAGLRLVIRDRDYELGESIAINISKAIRCSRRTLLLLSRNFLKNRWCNFELNMAQMESVYTKRDVIILIFLESISPDKLPLAIMDLLRCCPNVKFPKDRNSQNVFWDQCITLLRK